MKNKMYANTDTSPKDTKPLDESTGDKKRIDYLENRVRQLTEQINKKAGEPACRIARKDSAGNHACDL